MGKLEVKGAERAGLEGRDCDGDTWKALSLRATPVNLRSGVPGPRAGRPRVSAVMSSQSPFPAEGGENREGSRARRAGRRVGEEKRENKQKSLSLAASFALDLHGSQ